MKKILFILLLSFCLISCKNSNYLISDEEMSKGVATLKQVHGQNTKIIGLKEKGGFLFPDVCRLIAIPTSDSAVFLYRMDSYGQLTIMPSPEIK